MEGKGFQTKTEQQNKAGTVGSWHWAEMQRNHIGLGGGSSSPDSTVSRHWQTWTEHAHCFLCTREVAWASWPTRQFHKAPLALWCHTRMQGREIQKTCVEFMKSSLQFPLTVYRMDTDSTFTKSFLRPTTRFLQRPKRKRLLQVCPTLAERSFRPWLKWTYMLFLWQIFAETFLPMSLSTLYASTKKLSLVFPKILPHCNHDFFKKKKNKNKNGCLCELS